MDSEGTTHVPWHEWPEWLTPAHTAIHTAIENEMKRALQHCFESADASGLSWTEEGWISCSASNIMGMLRRAGSNPPTVGDVAAWPMPRREWSDFEEFEEYEDIDPLPWAGAARSAIAEERWKGSR